ncbi:amino acid permease, partial [Rhizobium ruizarguesonis]
ASGQAGMHAPLAFLVAAAVMGLIAASFAELGTRMPVSASESSYVDSAFGLRWFTIVTGFQVIVTAIISAATLTST